MITAKIEKLQEYCRTNNFDWLVMANFGHELSDAIVYYVLLQNPEHGILLIPSSGKPILFITPFEVAETQAKFPEIDVRPLTQKFVALISKTIPSNKKIAIRAGVFPSQAYLALEQLHYVLEPAHDVEKIVAIKTTSEIQAMRAVASLTDNCFQELIKNWKQFKTEKDVARFVNNFALQHDVEISFPTIVASAGNASHPHHSTLSTQLERGFCVIDMGLRLNGYCSDMTRTIFLGTPIANERALYEKIKIIQEKTIKLIAPGVAIAGLDIFCRSELKELNKYFIHGLGHGVDTQVHEWPGITERNTDILQQNMIITIEPGVYKENEFGIRIEDDVMVTDIGYEILTPTSRDLIIIN